MGKYKLINEDTMKNLIEFLDEVQFDAATEGDVESMHKVNFCSWAITELLNSPEASIKNNPKKKLIKDRPFKPHIVDVAEYMSLEDIKEMLLDDPELSDYDRFELYYTEHKRVQKEKKKANDMLKMEYKKYKANRKKNTKKK